MFYDDHFKAIEKKFPNFSYNVALLRSNEEKINWKGYTGFIHQVVLENYLSKHEDRLRLSTICGPPDEFSCINHVI